MNYTDELKICIYPIVRWQKNNSFANFGFRGWLAAVCKCVVLWAGFPLSLRGGRKNKINSPQTAPPYQRSTYPVNPFFIIISIFYIVSKCHVGSPHLLTTLRVCIGRVFVADSLSTVTAIASEPGACKLL